MTDQNLLLREDGYPHLNTDIGENMSYNATKPQCKCNGNPHTLECLYQHFLSYTGYEHSESLFKAYSDGADSRAMPLPEVKQMRAPKDWSIYDSALIVDFIRENSYFDARLIGDMLNFSIQSAKNPLPDVTQQSEAEALRKENEQLRKEAPKWNTADIIPTVKAGDCKEFIVHAKSKQNNKEHVFSAMYLNEMELESPSTGEVKSFSGWHSAKEHSDYDGFYESLNSHEVLTWMELPSVPSALKGGAA